MTHDRRDFLRRSLLGAAGAAIPIPTEADGQPPATPTSGAQPPSRALDAVMLAALGDAILPESLGAAGRARAIAAFTAWLAAYVPVAEEMHGYGYAELTYTRSDPAPGWRAQLQALDLLARRIRRRGFVQLDLAGRHAVLDAALRGGRHGTLPSSPLGADHVAVALLAHWAATSEAQDLAYGARIGAGQCRSLAETARRPLPIVGETPR
ncbi:MAG: hypothetical protein P3A32_07875 [Gemmatimonadota bacterium]|nr:hypothetical protein [Gemmatimonadota bacterium]MDQ8147557.1 hypothetical protein [Gemmatimonadota bacterium]MDQ8149720.1 hypothetical protein [Gemmatimonadota bacterium]MDQ8177020.1 hypothetical protein [Gemmatimonadota bacterium]